VVGIGSRLLVEVLAEITSFVTGSASSGENTDRGYCSEPDGVQFLLKKSKNLEQRSAASEGVGLSGVWRRRWKLREAYSNKRSCWNGSSIQFFTSLLSC